MKRVVLAIALASSVASAQPDDQAATDKRDADKKAAADAFARGQKHFLAGEYLPAAEAFEAAYALDADPVYLYNIAQAYRNGSACARAADYYRRFLAVVPNPPNLDKVKHYLEELDACAKAESTEVVPQPPTPAVVTPLPAAPPPILVESSHARFDRHLGLALGAGGIVALGVGAWFTHDVHTLEGYHSAICAGDTTCVWDSTKQARAVDLEHRGDRATWISVGAYTAGGAAVISGALLYWLGNRAPREAAVSAVPLEHGAAVLARFEF